MNILHISNRIGILGEKIASKYLQDRGYSILSQNYLEKTGEIDIVAKKNKILYFCEVKARSVHSLEAIHEQTSYVFNNVHPVKLTRFKRTIELYLLKNNVPRETAWQISLLGVYIHEEAKKAKVITIENVI